MPRARVSLLCLALCLAALPAAAVEDPRPLLADPQDETTQLRLQSDDGNWRLLPGGYLAMRYRLGYEDYWPWDTTSTFHIPRAKLFAVGTVFRPTVRYKLQVNLGGDALEDGRVLEDAFAEWAPGPLFAVRAGQFKAPFGRQWLTSASRLSFVDRALAHVIDEVDPNIAAFNLGRQAGLMVHGDTDVTEYRVAVLNGNGAKPLGDWDNPRPLIVVRLAVTPFGPLPYEEGCVGEWYWDETVLAIGVNAFYQMHPAVDTSGFGADVAFRYGRLAADLEASVRLRHARQTHGSFGGHAQASLFLDELGLLVGARYALVMEDLGDPELRRHEAGPALTYLPWGHHNAKLTMDVLLLAEELPELHLSPTLRVQALLRF